jgi:hypothetical protein
MGFTRSFQDQRRWKGSVEERYVVYRGPRKRSGIIRWGRRSFIDIAEEDGEKRPRPRRVDVSCRTRGS